MDVTKFSERAREALETAQGVVRRGPGNMLGTEHLLIGVLSLPGGVVEQILNLLGIVKGAAMTRANQFAQNGTLERAGGSPAVDELAGWVPAAGHARAYARIVRDHATRRALLHASYEIQQHALAGHGDVDELLADASKRVGDLLEQSLPAG